MTFCPRAKRLDTKGHPAPSWHKTTAKKKKAEAKSDLAKAKLQKNRVLKISLNPDGAWIRTNKNNMSEQETKFNEDTGKDFNEDTGKGFKEDKPKIEEELSRKDLIRELSDFINKLEQVDNANDLPEFHDTELDGTYNKGFYGALNRVYDLVEELKRKVPELQK